MESVVFHELLFRQEFQAHAFRLKFMPFHVAISRVQARSIALPGPFAVIEDQLHLREAEFLRDELEVYPKLRDRLAALRFQLQPMTQSQSVSGFLAQIKRLAH